MAGETAAGAVKERTLFGHPIGHFTFTDKRVGASGESGLLTGVQMADKDNDQCLRASLAEFAQRRSWRDAGE